MNAYPVLLVKPFAGGEAPIPQDQHLLAERFHVAQDVRGQQHPATAADVADEGAQLPGLGRVEPCRGFVQDHHLGFVNERLGDAHPLRHALGEPAAETCAESPQVELPFDPLPGAACRFALHAPQSCGEIEVLVHGEIGVERRALRQQAEVTLGLAGVAVQIDSQDLHPAAGGAQGTAQQRQRGGFSGAVDAQQAEYLPAAQDQVEPFETLIAPVAAPQVAGLE